MKKFEIINDKWIKHNPLNDNFDAIKIAAIVKFVVYDSNIHLPLGEEAKIISFINNSQGAYFSLVYKKSEQEEFKDDLAFFEKLLFKQ